MTGRIDDIDVVVVPNGVGRGRLDRDPPLALQLHGIHGGTDVILALDLVHRVNAARVIENPLGERGLSRVDMGTDADISNLVQIREHDRLAIRPTGGSSGEAKQEGSPMNRKFQRGWVAAHISEVSIRFPPGPRGSNEVPIGTHRSLGAPRKPWFFGKLRPALRDREALSRHQAAVRGRLLRPLTHARFGERNLSPEGSHA